MNRDRFKSCPLCGSVRVTTVFDLDHYSTAECSSCRLQFVTTIPSSEEMADAYNKGTYESYFIHPSPQDVRKIALGNAAYCNALYPGKGRRVLDMGCGEGQFLEILGTQGWAAFGVELSKDSANIARGKRGVQHVETGFFEDYPEGGDPFDLITMWMVLEHVSDPKRVIEKARRLLGKQGALVLTVPNGRSFLHLMAAMLYRLSRGRITQPLEKLINFEHINAFSGRSLIKGFERLGFRRLKTLEDERYITKFTLSRLPLVQKVLFYGAARAGQVLRCKEMLVMAFLKACH